MGISCFNSSADLEILFDDDPAVFFQQCWAVDEEERRPLKQLKKCTLNYPSSRDRNLAEKNRREKLTHRFIALSSLLPRLKKMDRASILEEAIRYTIQLQKKVETLEKKIGIKSCVKSISNQGLLLSDDDESSLPLIKAKIYNSEVLISVHCERRKGVLEKIEKLHLSVVGCSVVPFGDSHLNITIIAEMDEYCGMSIEEVVNNLHAALKI